MRNIFPGKVERIKILYVFGFITFVGISCVPPQPPTKEMVEVDVKLNASHQTILEFQDQLLVDSLANYLNSDDVTLRYLAARAFASMSAEDHSDKLKELLKDTVRMVAAMAAYSIGQQADSSYQHALLDAFKQRDSINVNNILNCNILEAIGKCGDPKYLDLVATTSSYLNTDTLLLLGQTRCIYRYGLRGIISSKGTARMASIAVDETFPDEVRILAAHYLQRIKGLELSEYRENLLKAISSSRNVDLKIALLESLKHLKHVEVLVYLIQNIPRLEDERLKTASIQAFRNFDFNSYIATLEYLLQTSGHLTRWVVADFLLANISSNEAGKIMELAEVQDEPITKVKLLKASYRHLPRFYVNSRESVKDQIIALYTSSKNIGQTVEVVHALGEDLLNLNMLIDIVQSTEITALKSAALENIIKIVASSEFDVSNRLVTEEMVLKVNAVLLSQFKSGDIAAVSLISDYAGPNKEKLTTYGFSSGILDSVFQNITLPAGIEAKRSLGKTLSKWNGYEYEEIIAPYNHPIDFSLLSGLPQYPRANISTTKGDIIIEFFVNDAPGTVSSFIRLMKLNYFTRKKFHRIVPNFVTQGGCNRGDGYGSLDFTLRSEFSPLYYDQGGYLGMASAGPHSESQQIFITHTATPHLDGRYTIFAKVVEGMDIVLKLSHEDNIQSIKMVTFDLM